MRISYRRVVRSALAALLASTALAGQAGAATFNVTNNGTSGAGSFLDAVTSANGTAGADTITFAQPLTGGQTIQLMTPGSTITGSTVLADSVDPVTIRVTGTQNSNNTINLNGSAPLTFRLGQGITLEKTANYGAAVNVAPGSAQATIIIDGNVIHGLTTNFYSYGVRSNAADTDLVVNGTVRTNGEFGEAVTGSFRTITVNGTVENTGLNGNGAISLYNQTLGATVTVGSAGIVRAESPTAIAMWFGSGDDVLELHAGATITGIINNIGGTDTLRLGGTTNGTFAAADLATQFQNFGRLEKTGSSTWTLTGASSFNGPTTVKAGTLAVNGTMFNSAVTVESGATLGGSGAVGSVIVDTGGTIAPGNSIGNFNATGGITFNTGSVYAVEVSPTGADSLGVSGGTANLSGGTVAVTFAPGTYVNRSYTILTSANGRGGTTFAGVTDNAPGIATSLTYDYYNVYLNIELVLAAIEQETNGGKTRTPLNQNQRAVAEAVDAYFAQHGTMPAAFVTLDANGLTQAAGLVSTASVGAGMQAAGQFLDAMAGAEAGSSASVGDASNAYAPLAYSAEPANLSSPGALAALGAEVPASSEAANAALAMSSAHAVDPVEQAFAKRWGMWGTVYGSVGRIGGDPVVGSADLTARNWGIASGFERSFGNSKLGLSLGGAGSTFSLAGGLGNGSAGIFNAGIYGSHSFGNAYVSAAFGYGWNNVRTTRNVPGDTLTANYNAHTLAGRLETGYRFGSTSAITPYVALQGGNYFLPAYTETSALNGPFALAYGRQSEAFLRTELGARFEHSMPTSTGSLKFSARAAWAYNAINDRAVTAAFAALPGQTFTVNGARPARSAALLDLGMEANFDSGLSAKINFNGEFSRNVSAYGASAKLIYRW